MSDRGENPKKYLTRAQRKWRVINKNKYPRTGIVNEYVVNDTLPYYKVIGYMKNNVLCLYWGVSKIKFEPMKCKELIFKLYKDSFEKMKECLKKIQYTGQIGFELCELEQLNIVVEYMIKRFGYSCYKKNGILIVDK